MDVIGTVGGVDPESLFVVIWPWTVLSAVFQRRFRWGGFLSSLLLVPLLISDYTTPGAFTCFVPWALFAGARDRQKIAYRLAFFYLLLSVLRIIYGKEPVFLGGLGLVVLIMALWSRVDWWIRVLLVWVLFGFAVKFWDTEILPLYAYYAVFILPIGGISLWYYLLGKGRVWAWLGQVALLGVFASDGNGFMSLLPLFAVPWIFSEFSGAENLRVPVAVPISVLVRIFIWSSFILLGWLIFSVPLEGWMPFLLLLIVLVLVSNEVIFDLSVNLHRVFGGVLRRWTGYETYINHRWIPLDVSIWGEVMAVLEDYTEGILSLVRMMRWGWMRAIVGLTSLLWGLLWIKG